ncbi:hypothetical protein [Virgisporangium aurantiacum]|uniref:Uncharacterized protein n=1 Tax=Virgisporangium aurantiacum TaxID=175570 RepID=A0A8J4DY07_9ACTN|nr:hypothetical protein [Virgisporangium aurantiacum]GIJ54131.1 hypothetical protein Vau01_016470 [Virgisporangium aurantiacum]
MSQRNQRGRGFRGLAADGADHVAVGVVRNLDRAVSVPLADDRDVDAGGDLEARGEVPDLVQGDPRRPVAVDELLDAVALERLALDLLAKAPDQRPEDAFAVYERLLPFLPQTGTPPVHPSPDLDGLPDPTLLYRRPNAPLRRLSTATPPPTPVTPIPPAIVPGTRIRGRGSPVRRPSG